MKKKRLLALGIIAIMLLMVAVPAFAEDGAEVAKDFGIISLLPPVLAIALAFITKQVILSLFLGIFTGAMMLNGWNPFIGFLRTLDQYIIGALADGWHASIIIFTLSIGGMVGIVSKMGGTKAIAESLAKKATTARGAQIVTAVLGCLVFFDDYANTLIVGPTMRPLTDKLKVSREKLAYIVDSTAAPVVGLAFVSTWVGYEIGIMTDAYAKIGVDINGFEVFFRTIPYAFYNLFAIVLVFSIAIMNRDFGPMYKAEKRARTTGKVLADGAHPMSSDSMDFDENKAEADKKPLKVKNAVIPILTLVIVAFAGLWYNGYQADPSVGVMDLRSCFGNADAGVALVWASIVASIVAGVMSKVQGYTNLQETFDTWVDGAKSLLITGIILILAWSIGTITSEVGTADFLVRTISDSVPGGLLPILVFIISCLVAFATGTSWGTMAIVVPLAIPLANAYIQTDPTTSTLILATLSAVLSGSIFGDHCSPISDTTIMSSMASGSDHIDHVKTQAPYAIFGACITIISYFLVGMVHVPVGVVLVIGVAAIIGFVKFVGKSTSEKTLNAK